MGNRDIFSRYKKKISKFINSSFLLKVNVFIKPFLLVENLFIKL